MQYMLDTDICIYLLNRKAPAAERRLAGLQPGAVVISAISAAELHFGVAKSRQRERNAQALAELLKYLPLIAFDADAAAAYGQLRQILEQAGTPIGPFDTQIAAHARSLGLILVTNNEKHFGRVPGLRVENWSAA